MTPIKRLYRNNERNVCGGAVVGFVGGPVFSPFCDFLHAFADKNSVVSSYLIVERGRDFLWGYIRKGARSFGGITERKKQ